jgi:ADP-ribosylglycohydrolase
LNNGSYKETALAAVNLGGDTDTTACVVGGLAGIYYGYEDIPSHWLEQIARFDYIDDMLGNFTDYLFEKIED